MKNLVRKYLLAGATSLVAISSAYLIIPHEGSKVNEAGEHVPYFDMVGVLTTCNGMTGKDPLGRPIDKNSTYSQEFCDKWYVKEVSTYNSQLKKKVTVPLYPHEEVAYTSFVWNVGLGAWNSSTLLRKLNAGDKEGACKQILVWNKATFDKKGADRQRSLGETCTAKSNQPGKNSCTVKGLTNRRVAEYQVCTNNNADVTKALKEVNLLETDEGVVENLSPEDISLDSKPLEALKSSTPSLPLTTEEIIVSSPAEASISSCKLRLFSLCLVKG